MWLLLAAAMIGAICLALWMAVSELLAAALGVFVACFLVSGLGAIWLRARWLALTYRCLELVLIWLVHLCLIVLPVWLLIKTFAR